MIYEGNCGLTDGLSHYDMKADYFSTVRRKDFDDDLSILFFPSDASGRIESRARPWDNSCLLEDCFAIAIGLNGQLEVLLMFLVDTTRFFYIWGLPSGMKALTRDGKCPLEIFYHTEFALRSTLQSAPFVRHFP